MAQRLVDAGAQVRVFDIAADAVRFFTAKGVIAAATGELTILMGGKREVCTAAEPVLRHFGTELHYCGALGSGQVVKLVNNLVSCANAAVLAEACGLAHKSGVDLGVLTKIMAGTAADSHQLRHMLIQRLPIHIEKLQIGTAGVRGAA